MVRVLVLTAALWTFGGVTATAQTPPVDVTISAECHNDGTWDAVFTYRHTAPTGAMWSVHGMYTEPTDWRPDTDSFTVRLGPLTGAPAGASVIRYYTIQGGGEWQLIGMSTLADDPNCEPVHVTPEPIMAGSPVAPVVWTKADLVHLKLERNGVTGG